MVASCVCFLLPPPRGGEGPRVGVLRTGLEVWAVDGLLEEKVDVQGVAVCA